jgi:hypothetical protein
MSAGETSNSFGGARGRSCYERLSGDEEAAKSSALHPHGAYLRDCEQKIGSARR